MDGRDVFGCEEGQAQRGQQTVAREIPPRPRARSPPPHRRA